MVNRVSAVGYKVIDCRIRMCLVLRDYILAISAAPLSWWIVVVEILRICLLRCIMADLLGVIWKQCVYILLRSRRIWSTPSHIGLFIS